MVCIMYLQKDYGFCLFRQASSSKRGWISHVALVVINVGFGQIGGIHHRVRLTEIQVDVQFKFFWRDDGAQFLERRLRRLPALEAPENFLSRRSFSGGGSRR